MNKGNAKPGYGEKMSYNTKFLQHRRRHSMSFNNIFNDLPGQGSGYFQTEEVVAR